MNKGKLQEIFAQPSVLDIIKGLQVSSYTGPKWADLKKQYNPQEHSILNTLLYPPRLDENGQDQFKRVPLALQKLVVNRIAQAMFSTPVVRSYSYDNTQDPLRQASTLFEELYRTHCFIDAVNIERAKKLLASCQMVSVWKVIEKSKPLIIQGQSSKYWLKVEVYSEKDGYTLYPIKDGNGELIAVSIEWVDNDNNAYFLTYADLDKPVGFLFTKTGGDWELLPENKKELTFFPCVYSSLQEPAWGGLEGTKIVEELEEMEAYNGMYTKRNQVPTFTLDYGEVSQGTKMAKTEESSTPFRRIIAVGRGGNMQDVTWQGAEESFSNRFQRLRNAFFEMNQTPDTSFANMIKSNTSAENKQLVFSDSKAKAEDLGGEWEILFYHECRIVKEFAKIMFPKFSKALDQIAIRSNITPYDFKTKKENAEYVSVAGDSMSLKTKIAILGEVDNVEDEIQAIQEQQSQLSNNL